MNTEKPTLTVMKTVKLVVRNGTGFGRVPSIWISFWVCPYCPWGPPLLSFELSLGWLQGRIVGHLGPQSRCNWFLIMVGLSDACSLFPPWWWVRFSAFSWLLRWGWPSLALKVLFALLLQLVCWGGTSRHQAQGLAGFGIVSGFGGFFAIVTVFLPHKLFGQQ